MICTSCKELVPGGYAYCLNCGQYLGEPTVVLPSAGPTRSATQTPAESASLGPPTTTPTGNRLPWLIAGVSFTVLFIVLLLGAAHFFFRNDQQTQQPSSSPSPGSAISQASVAPESGPTPALAATKQERPQPSVATLPSPAALSNESTTTPRVGADDPNRIYSGNDVSSKARILSKPQPSYTEEARQNQVTGTVVLRAVFTSSGEVKNITARSGLPHGLTERAIAAAREIKFVPATKDGRSVSMYIQLEYNFNLY
jgi:TonB family protein